MKEKKITSLSQCVCRQTTVKKREVMSLIFPLVRIWKIFQSDLLEKYREDVGKAFNRITLFIASRNDFLMAELPTLDDDIEIDLDDNIDLEISVFARMESTVHKKARPSDEMKTRVAQNGALFLDAGTSEDKATVIDNPSPSNQDTDTVHTLNQDKFIGCAWQINYFTVIREKQNAFQPFMNLFIVICVLRHTFFPKYSERLLLV